MYETLTVSGALAQEQVGFRKGHSATTCLTKFIDTIYSNMDRWEFSGVIFLDLHKAFKTVNHNILLFKLEEIGFGNIFADYIANCLQIESKSLKCHILFQMKNLSSTGHHKAQYWAPCYLWYVNSLPTCLPTSINTNLYADDTALVPAGKSVDDVVITLRAALLCAAKWFQNHKLSLNVQKIKIMFFATAAKIRTMSDPPVLMYTNETVDVISNFKYLGWPWTEVSPLMITCHIWGIKCLSN